MIGRRHVRTIWNAIGDRPAGIDLIRPIARGLRVKPGEISDWTGDDDIWDEPEMKASPETATPGPVLRRRRRGRWATTAPGSTS